MNLMCDQLCCSIAMSKPMYMNLQVKINQMRKYGSMINIGVQKHINNILIVISLAQMFLLMMKANGKKQQKIVKNFLTNLRIYSTS